MPSYLAALCFCGGIAGLFYLDRDRAKRTSGALWLAILWFAIVGSRNVSEWLETGARVDAGNAYMEGSAVDRNVLTLLLAGGVVALIRRGSRVSRVVRLNWPIAVYFGYCAISLLWADYPLVGMKRWFRGAGDVVMVLVIVTDPQPAIAVQRVLTRVGFVLLPVSVLLIRYFPELGRTYISWSGAAVWTGVAGGKNGLGMTCLIYGLAAVWCFIQAWRGGERQHRTGRLIARGVTAATAIYLLLLVDSKTALMCFVLAAGLLVVAAVGPAARRIALVHAMVFVSIAVPYAVLFMDLGESVLQAIGRDPSLTGRTDIWSVVTEFAENPVFGAGYENFWLGGRLAAITRAHGVFFTQAHNGYLEIYLNLGAIGLMLLGLLIVTGYRNVIHRFRANPTEASLRLSYVVVAIIYNFSEGAFKMMSSVWIAFLLSAIAEPPRRSTPAEVRRGIGQPHRFRETPAVAR